MNTQKAFDIEFQWQEYLLRHGLREEYMEPEHCKQLKEAFYGAIGIVLVILKSEKHTEKEAVAGWKSMLEQVGDFFLNSNNQLN